MPLSFTRGARAGGILHLPAALERYPDHGIVVYNRVSSYGKQTGKDKSKLQEKTDAARAEVRARAPGKLRCTVQGVELGKLSAPRPKLRRATDYAARHELIIVANDLSRFIRSEAYDRHTNNEAVPTAEEFARLHELTGGAVLATLADPLMTEKERQSLATRRTGKAGRPRSIDDALAEKIFADLGWLVYLENGTARWECPIAEVARAFGVSIGAIYRALHRNSPSGKTWWRLALEKAVAVGLMEIRDGEICSKCGTGPIIIHRGWWGKRGRPKKGARDMYWCFGTTDPDDLPL